MEGRERQEMVKVAMAHAEAEAAGDLEATMATLVEDPVYELQPMGRQLRGGAATRAYYEHFFSAFLPTVKGYTLRNEWVSDEGLGQEYTMEVGGPDGAAHPHAIIGILVFGPGGKLAGERLYAADDVLGAMFGPTLGATTPLA